MGKEVNFEIDQMLSLMERMDSHKTLSEAVMMEEILKEKNDIGRMTFTDIDQFLSTAEIAKGKMVGLCYIQGYEASKIYPQKNNFAGELQSKMGGMDPNHRLYNKMNNLVNDPEMKTPTGRAYGGFKSMKTIPFAGVIKATNYVFNWGDTESLGNFYDKYRNAKSSARLKYGFGGDDSEYDADDWRRNPDFRGIGKYEVSADKRKNPDGSDIVAPYNQKLNPDVSLYGDTDTYGNPKMSTRADGSTYQKRAFKFGLNNVRQQWSRIFLVDNNGEIDDVEKSLGKMFYKMSLPKDIAGSITQQMSQDEINCRKELSQIEMNRAATVKEWITDNIAYIVAKGVDRYTGEPTAFRWINSNISIDKFNVNPNELKKIVDAEISKVTPEVMA